jgi:hypothetical protein
MAKYNPMNKESCACEEIGRLLEKAKKKKLEGIRQKTLAESCYTLADGIIENHKFIPPKEFFPMSESADKSPDQKSRPVPIVIRGEKGEIFLKRSPRSSDPDEKDLWMYFRKDDSTPKSEQNEIKLFYFDGKSSISSIEGKLETPDQFRELKNILEFMQERLGPKVNPRESASSK